MKQFPFPDKPFTPGGFEKRRRGKFDPIVRRQDGDLYNLLTDMFNPNPTKRVTAQVKKHFKIEHRIGYLLIKIQLIVGKTNF